MEGFGQWHTSLMESANTILVNGGTHQQAFNHMISKMGLEENSKAQTLAAAPFGVSPVKDNGRGQENVAANIGAGQSQDVGRTV